MANLQGSFDDSLIVGWRLSVVLLRRTPLVWLQRHGEFHLGSKMPTEIVPMDAAYWMPVLKTWRELGIDTNEFPEGTMASEAGQVPLNGGDFLPFLKEYRMIVEDKGGTLADLVKRYPQYRDVVYSPRKPPKGPLRKPVLAISMRDYAEIPGSTDKFHFNFEFHCEECGGYIISTPDAESEPVTCKACGAVFDTLAKLKDACRTIATNELKARKLGAYRDI